MGVIRSIRRRGLLLLAGCAVAAHSLGADEPEEALALIAKARAHLGTEAAIAAVDAIRYDGTIEFFGSASKGRVRIVVQKPDFQRMEIELDEVRQVVAVDDLQGWEMVVDKREEVPRRTVRYLSSPEFWKNHFTALENLWFHHAFERGRGHLVWGGESVFEGRLVGLVTVRYDDTNIFTRRFDTKTGELVVSVGSDGTEVRERDWVVIEGIRFPRMMEYYRDDERTSRVTFERIEVNPDLDPAIFRYPVF